MWSAFLQALDYGTVIPGSMITGAVFMLLADIISRVINAPSETPVGLVFAVVGVPFFIWTARKGADEMTDAKQKKRVCIVSLILLILLAVGILADIYAGYSRLSLQDFWEIILGGGDPGLRYTLIQLRLPRIFTSLLVGVGLGLAGGIIQGVAKNDMAEPGILGINAGAGLALAVFGCILQAAARI